MSHSETLRFISNSATLECCSLVWQYSIIISTTRKDKHLLNVYGIINKINNLAPYFLPFLTHLLESEEAGQSISAHALSAFSSDLIM